MSTTTARRKRARKACIPCHQRKRKCDAEYPCGMCTTYEYDCRYAAHDDDTTGTTGGGVAKRVGVDGGSGMPSRAAATSPGPGSRSRVERSPRETHGSSTKSPLPTAEASRTTPTGIFDEHKSRYAGPS